MTDLLNANLKNVIKKVFGSSDYFSDEKVEKMVQFVNFLKDENQKKNLVSRKSTDDELVNRHILSSLLFVKHILMLGEKRLISRIADIGSGSGFPSIICAICLPEIEFAVVDSIQKKIDFLYDTASLLELKFRMFLG